MPAVRFEKWQALGNDYLIVERDALPVPLSPGARADGCATRTSAPAATACSSSRRPTQPGLRRAPADLQPRRLGGRAVGQRRARGDPVPAPPRLDGRRHVLDRDRRGRDPPDDHRPDDLPRRHGPRRLRSKDFPGGPDGTAASRPARLALPARLDRQPAVRDPRRDARRARGARPRRRSARRSSTRRCSRTARTRRSGPSSAPGRDPRADLRARRGGDALLAAPARAARPSPTCCAAATRRSPSARRRRARGRRRRVPARRPHRLGGARLPRRAERRADRRLRRVLRQ